VDFVGGLLLIATLVAGGPLRRHVGFYVLLFLLGILQGVLATEGFHHKYIGMFHPVTALVLLGLSGRLAQVAWKEAHARKAEPPPAGTTQ
jgi:hypothetical protein